MGAALDLRFQPMLTDAVALSRFAVLPGTSGRAYVFSRIDWAQAPLYDRAVFAVEQPCGSLQLSRRAPLRLVGSDTTLHVHMLSAGCEAEALFIDVSDGGRIAA